MSTEDDYPQDRLPMSAYEMTGHNDLCAQWVPQWTEGREGLWRDPTAICTCGGTELPGHLRTLADIELARR